MQRAYDQVISPADMAKTILDELQGFSPFNVLKHSFWYLMAIGILLLICFCIFSVRCSAIQTQLLELNTSLHREHLRNIKGEGEVLRENEERSGIIINNDG
jgi:hypothetical protein